MNRIIEIKPKIKIPIDKTAEAILFSSSFLSLLKKSENTGINAVASAPAIISWKKKSGNFDEAK